MKIHVVWVVVCALVALGVYNASQKPPQVVERRIEATVTKEVPVEKIVEKIVEVPASIPEEYVRYKNFFENFSNAQAITRNDGLTGIGSVRVVVTVDDKMNQTVRDQELKDRFELALRKNGITVSKDAAFVLYVDVNGIWETEAKRSLSYTVSVELSQFATLLRRDNFKKISVTTWNAAFVGSAGSLHAAEGVNDMIDKLIIQFSNAYLEVNPK